MLRSVFVRWALAAGVLAFALVTGFSIGVFVMPVGLLLLIWALVGEQRATPMLAGIACGLGAVLIVIGAINAGTDWGRGLLLGGAAMVAAALAGGAWACRRGAHT